MDAVDTTVDGEPAWVSKGNLPTGGGDGEWKSLDILVVLHGGVSYEFFAAFGEQEPDRSVLTEIIASFKFSDNPG